MRLRIRAASWEARIGGKTPWAKPLKGFGGAGVLEIVDDHDGDTWRAVYVLHAFQKKLNSGIATPRQQMALIEQRLKRAREDYERWQAGIKTPR